jgi:hypothetical protein
MSEHLLAEEIQTPGNQANNVLTKPDAMDQTKEAKKWPT